MNSSSSYLARLTNAAVALVVLSHCASAPRAPEPDHQHITRVRRVALVVDIGIIRDSNDGKLWKAPQSKQAVEDAVQALRQRVEALGYQVVSTEASSMGAFFAGSRTFDVETLEGATKEGYALPFFYGDTGRGPASTSVSLMKTTFGDPDDDDQWITAEIPSQITQPEAKEALKSYAQAKGAEAVILCAVYGKSVSTGKQLAQGIGLGLATTVLTMGMATYTQWEVSHLRGALAWVEPSNGKVHWAHQISGRGEEFLEPKYFDAVWADKQLGGLPGHVGRAPASEKSRN